MKHNENEKNIFYLNTINQRLNKIFEVNDKIFNNSLEEAIETYKTANILER